MSGPTLRVRCEVLRLLAIHGPCTSGEIVLASCGQLTAPQVQKALYRLLDQDRIRKTGEQRPRQGSDGRPMYLYEAREDWEPGQDSSRERRRPKRGRKDYRASLAASSPGSLPDDDRPAQPFAGLIKFRDRKVRLLQQYLARSSDTERDLLLGMLADYGYREAPRRTAA